MLRIQQDEVTRIDSARTIAGRGFYWSTAYFVAGVLVDTGCAHSAHELADLMRDKNLKAIINTHTHEDHIGANGILQDQQKEVEIFAHSTGLHVLNHPLENQPLQMYRRVIWGQPLPCVGKAVEDGDVIEIGEASFKVIHTPGHSPDHICLFEQNRGWLFSGDLFVGGKDRALRADNDIWQLIASLKRVTKLPLTRLYPGSARIRENPVQALSDKINYLEETGDRVLALYKQGISKKEIAGRMFGGAMPIEFFTMGDFTRLNLVESFLKAAE